MRLRRVPVMILLLIFMWSVMQIQAQEKIKFFQPLKEGECLFGKTVIGKTEKAFLFKKTVDDKEDQVCELGVMADFGFNIFIKTKRL